MQVNTGKYCKYAKLRLGFHGRDYLMSEQENELTIVSHKSTPLYWSTPQYSCNVKAMGYKAIELCILFVEFEFIG
jgi:hypothetical protein